LHGGVEHFLLEALSKIESKGERFLVESVDLGRIVGESICVPTEPGDEIVYAQRLGRSGLTRFVKNKRPRPCSSVTVILLAVENNQYLLITAFVGLKAAPEPWDKNVEEHSLEFWNSHAIVYGTEPIIPGTETAQCPWTREEVPKDELVKT